MPVRSARSPVTSQTAANSGVPGAHIGNSIQGWTPASSSTGSGTQRSCGGPAGPGPVASPQSVSSSPIVVPTVPGTLTTPGMPRRVLSTSQVARSRASVTRTGRPGSPGARTVPPRAIRLSHQGSRPTCSCGPTISPGRTIRCWPGSSCATARSLPALSLPYPSSSTEPSASGGQSSTGDSSLTGTSPKPRYTESEET